MRVEWGTAGGAPVYAIWPAVGAASPAQELSASAAALGAMGAKGAALT